MEMTEMNKDLPFVLVVGLEINERPYIHGYSDEKERDKAYEEFKETGELTLYDSVLGAVKSFVPAYVARFDMIDGSLNRTRIQEEIDGLTK